MIDDEDKSKRKPHIPIHPYTPLYTPIHHHKLTGPESDPLKVRLMFNIAHRTADENKLMLYHQKLKDQKEDQVHLTFDDIPSQTNTFYTILSHTTTSYHHFYVFYPSQIYLFLTFVSRITLPPFSPPFPPFQLSLAAVHYLRSHHQEATDIYKRLLLENRDDFALNVYVAMCYYKLDYYDVSLEILAVYLQSHPESPIGVNLKACNHFRLYNGKAAEAELKTLSDKGVNVAGNK